MWHILRCSSQLTLVRSSLRQYWKPFRTKISSNFAEANNNVCKTKQCPVYTFTFTKVSLALAGGGLLKVIFDNKVLCKPQTNRLTGYHSKSNDLRFDWKQFWLYLRPHILYFIAGIIGALVVAFLNIQIPQLMGSLINVISKFTVDKDSEQFFAEMKMPAVKLITMYITQSVFTFFYINMLSKLGERMAYQMKTDLFTSILNQDIAFFDQNRTGDVINRLTSDIQNFKSCFKQVISGGLRAGAQIIGCTVSLVMISPHMTLVTVLFIPTVITLGTLFGSSLRKTSNEAHSQVEKTTTVAEEAVSNIRTVRAFGMEDLEKEMYSNEAYKAMVLNERLGTGIGLFQAGTNMFLNSMVLGTLYMGGYLLSTNQLSAGELMAFLMATQTIQRSLGQLSLLFGTIVRGAASGARVFEYIKREPKMPLKGGDVIPYEFITGEVEFKNISFSYPSRPQHIVLKNFNLKVPAGRTVALVGASGSGKTTVVALLQRFYDSGEGKITIDGHDVSKLDPTWFRQNVLGIISQEPVLFATSVMENIRYGKPDASDEEVYHAAKLANAHEFITDFPEGYDTLVGERGATLSGGQKQRIAIARALLKNPAVLLLDEATSALDAESESVVQAALEKARTGRTVLVIAHRLSTIQNADLIVVLHKGRILETGTHESLKNKKGYYWALVHQQQDIPAG